MNTVATVQSMLLSTMKKPLSVDDSTALPAKRVKRSLDVTSHWKKIQRFVETSTTQVFECRSKTDYLTMIDPVGDRSHFVISKSSYYWLNESIRLMQQHIEYGTTFDAALLGEIVEIERNLKALKCNVEKQGIAKTFFFRAEALVNLIRLCCTLHENPPEKFRRRLHALFNVCANCWLHMFDIVLPKSIVRVEESFLFDDDYGDFENDSILRRYLKADQKKIQKTHMDLPNLRHILYSILLLIEKFHSLQLVDEVYLGRFETIYQIWLSIDNEISSREQILVEKMKKTSTKKSTQRISWNFIGDCQIYEKMFGTFTSNMK
ncbi:unnamed protein product [Adineta ricciae]|uniref:Uncharacterized protein n=1 Tax=Adineta ricciae TaxID=249248 RepID=A0A816A928_ADIRI|nr:unnamed protein product [Adineta ricciae]CAF1593015.1 unnamed protein product [Adineta ricciae]